MDRTLEQEAVALLTHHVPGAVMHPGSGEDEGVLQLRHRDSAYVVDVETTQSRGIEDLVGRLAIAILVSEREAREHQAMPFALVASPRLGRRALDALETFVARHRPSLAWGAFDQTGTVRLVVPGMGLDLFTRGASPPKNVVSRPRNVSLFTDLNQWLLKVLLLADVEPRYWGGPTEPVENRAELARVAKVSTQKAYTFTSTFEQADLLRVTPRGLHVVDRRACFSAWYQALAQRPRPRVAVRSPYGLPPLLEFLRERSEPYAIGGFDACALHEVLFTAQRLSEVHVFSPVSALLEQWELEVCAPRDAHFFLLPSRRGEAIKRGIVLREGVVVVDLLQAALDLAHHPLKGREQADHIVTEVLGW